MYKMSNKEAADRLHAILYTRNVQKHDELHTRELTEQGQLNKRLQSDLSAFSRRNVRF